MTHSINGARDLVPNRKVSFNGPYMQHIASTNLHILDSKFCALKEK